MGKHTTSRKQIPFSSQEMMESVADQLEALASEWELAKIGDVIERLLLDRTLYQAPENSPELTDDEKKIVEDACIAGNTTVPQMQHDGLLMMAKRINSTQDYLKNASAEDLRKTGAKGAAAERIKRCVEALKEWNSQKAQSKDLEEQTECYYITVTLIRKLTGSRYAAVKAYIEENQDTIEAHHTEFNLDEDVNRKGKGNDVFDKLKVFVDESVA